MLRHGVLPRPRHILLLYTNDYTVHCTYSHTTYVIILPAYSQSDSISALATANNSASKTPARVCPEYAILYRTNPDALAWPATCSPL